MRVGCFVVLEMNTQWRGKRWGKWDDAQGLLKVLVGWDCPSLSCTVDQSLVP